MAVRLERCKESLEKDDLKGARETAETINQLAEELEHSCWFKETTCEETR